MKWYDPTEMKVTGMCDSNYSIKQIIENLMEQTAGGAGAEVFCKTGSGTFKLGYFDGDGLGVVKVGEITKSEQSK